MAADPFSARLTTTMTTEAAAPALDPRLRWLDCADAAGGHRMAYWLWGDAAAAHTIVCVHGLTRQGRDFDVLARALLARSAAPLRIVCPDVVGRGRSGWLKDPSAYGFPQYVADMATLVAALHAQAPVGALDWVGTSMGGLIGLMLAASPADALAAPVRRLVLNDVGPAIEWSALQRIGGYLGQTGRFASVQEGAQALRALQQGFGPHTDAVWLALSRPMLRTLPEGGWTLHYDPAIAEPYHAMTPEAAAQGEQVLWQLYDAIKAPTLVLRGGVSDLLSAATAQAMTQRGPRAQLLTLEGIGHAPTLVHDDQTQAVADFLLAPDAAGAAGGARAGG